MKEFIKNLLSSEKDTSSKRFSALFTLINVLVLTYIATFNNKGITPEFMFNSLCLIIAGGLGLTVLDKLIGKKNSVDVTTPVEEPKKTEEPDPNEPKEDEEVK